MEILEEIVIAISELNDSGKVRELIEIALGSGISPTNIVEMGVRKGLDEVGKRYETGEYFLSELLFAGVIVNEALNVLRPSIASKGLKVKEKIVLGTVRGDLHDLGKNIFKMLADASGFNVIDLGVDVDPDVFVGELRESHARILGMSALLTTTISELSIVIDALKSAGMRDRVKVLLGGNAVTKEFGKSVGADAVALDAVEGVEICKRWVEESST